MSRQFVDWMDTRFQFSSRGSTFKTELLAGLASFSTMSYVLVVNPLVLSQAGMDRAALITASAVISALFCIVMGLWTNYPLAMAPGMGSNVYVAVQVCQTMHVPWQAALGLVFYAGLLFFVVSVTGLRQSIMNAFPPMFKKTISAGIGLFLAFVGLRTGGILISSSRSLVGLGHIASPPVLLALVGIIVVFVLVVRGVPGALIWAILFVTGAGLFIPNGTGQGAITPHPHTLFSTPASIVPIAFKLDLRWFWTHLPQAIPVVLALLFIDLFSAMAVLFAIGQRANLNDAEGNLPRLRQALEADSLAACGAAVLGSTTAIIYLESAAGVEQGGRTGLMSLSTAMCFLIALVFTPVIFIIPPLATTPALVAIGAFMLQGLSELNLREPTVAFTVLITSLMMALTSISDGMGIGFLISLAVSAFTGQARSIKPMAWGLAALFLWHFLS